RTQYCWRRIVVAEDIVESTHGGRYHTNSATAAVVSGGALTSCQYEPEGRRSQPLKDFYLFAHIQSRKSKSSMWVAGSFLPSVGLRPLWIRGSARHLMLKACYSLWRSRQRSTTDLQV
ncbi:unnamed protein product, partial [Ectocarpus fasciculatus]